DTRKAWDTMAATLKDVDGFTRPGMDGKKAQNRFLLLVRHHKSNNNEAARLSGATEDETPKSRLVDDLVPLYNDAASKTRAATPLSEAEEKAASIKFIREQAMLRGKRKSLESSDSSDVGGLSKKKLILEAQDKEVELEKEWLAFKKPKFERKIEEREKDRAERELERQERQQIRVSGGGDPTASSCNGPDGKPPTTKGVLTECGRAHALQQHELQVTAHRDRIAADRRQAHFEWEQRQIHQAAAQYKYAVKHDAAGISKSVDVLRNGQQSDVGSSATSDLDGLVATVDGGALINAYTPTKPPVYGKDSFKERDQQKLAKRFIVYARGQDAISVSSGVRIGTVSMSSGITAEALAHHARFQFDLPIEDIRETEWEAMFEASMLIPTSSKAVVVARLKLLSMDNTLIRTSDCMTDW
ncbi:hypothetical protein DYB36_013330, partial [Aphanomyces astaci]